MRYLYTVGGLSDRQLPLSKQITLKIPVAIKCARNVHCVKIPIHRVWNVDRLKYYFGLR